MALLRLSLPFLIVWIAHLSGTSSSNEITSLPPTTHLTQLPDKGIHSLAATVPPALRVPIANHSRPAAPPEVPLTKQHHASNSTTPKNDTEAHQATSSDEGPFDINGTVSLNQFHGGNVSDRNGSDPKTLTLTHSNYVDLDLRGAAGFAAIGFLGVSVLGYAGFVLWRRYLQNKYGNGQTLITDDVYDISDLRYFEI